MKLMNLMLLVIVLLTFGRAIAHPLPSGLVENFDPTKEVTNRLGQTTRYIVRSNSPHPAAASAAGRTVEVRGRLHVTDDRMNDVTLVVEVEGGHLLHAQLLPNGRFKFILPADVRARLFFQKPDHLEKEVWMDTRHAHVGERRSIRRKVSFDVVLVRLTSEPAMASEGPEGCIRFIQGSGMLRVHYYEGSLLGQLGEQRREDRSNCDR